MYDLDLESAVQSIMAKSGDSAAIQEKRLKQFIAVLKSKGYFQGVKEGTPAYFERYETAKRKFEQDRWTLSRPPQIIKIHIFRIPPLSHQTTPPQ